MAQFEEGYKKTMAPNRTYSYYTGSWYDSEFEGNSMSYLKLLHGIDYHEQGLVFSVPFLPGGRYKPDVWYAVQRKGVTTIGTAKKPLAIGEIKGFKGAEDKVDTNELKRRFMASLVDDPGDEVVFAFWQMRDDLGILGYDGKAADWEPAGIYVCPDCGHTYYAVNGRDACPYCRNRNTKFITDKVNGSWVDWWHKVADETQNRMSDNTALSIRSDGKQIWDEVIDEFEEQFRDGLCDFDGIEPERAPLPDELKNVDWKALVRDTYTS